MGISKYISDAEYNHKYLCTLCGRNKFKKKQPHKCKGGYRKRKLIFIKQ